jgi:hypothetical protein
LCEEGFLKNITYTKESDSVNCEYAKFAINELRENKDISKNKMRLKIQKKIGKPIAHNGQLDIVFGLWEFLKNK